MLHQELAQVSDGETLPVDWEYKYRLPTNYARAVAVTDAAGMEVNYEVMGVHLFTNHKRIFLRFVRNYTALDDATTFPDEFAEVVACAIAADLCVSLTQSDTLRAQMLEEFSYNLSSARFSNAVEAPLAKVDADWLDARNMGLGSDIDPRIRGLQGY